MTTISRRDLLKLLNRVLIVSGVAAVFGPVVAYFYPPSLEETPTEPVSAGLVADLPAEGKIVPFGRYPALVIPTAQGIRAYSAVCTHFACLVKWDAGRGQIVCPCHDGYFDPTDGHVISGPPPTPLISLPVAIIDGHIYVGGGE